MNEHTAQELLAMIVALENRVIRLEELLVEPPRGPTAKSEPRTQTEALVEAEHTLVQLLREFILAAESR
jgi:hypothetical protein